uniref:Uncharacterized protein n=1 Tax=Picea glauca TaxID=3330 RepID=A0A101M1Y3_PICGL|nr:hypothetical protein ABT39_MTgene2781 [Picea glauca]
MSIWIRLAQWRAIGYDSSQAWRFATMTLTTTVRMTLTTTVRSILTPNVVHPDRIRHVQAISESSGMYRQYFGYQQCSTFARLNDLMMLQSMFQSTS